MLLNLPWSSRSSQAHKNVYESSRRPLFWLEFILHLLLLPLTVGVIVLQTLIDHMKEGKHIFFIINLQIVLWFSSSRCSMKFSKVLKGQTGHDAQENISQLVVSTTSLLVSSSSSPETLSKLDLSRATLHQRRPGMKGVGLQVHNLVDTPEEDCIQ